MSTRRNTQRQYGRQSPGSPQCARLCQSYVRNKKKIWYFYFVYRSYLILFVVIYARVLPHLDVSTRLRYFIRLLQKRAIIFFFITGQRSAGKQWRISYAKECVYGITIESSKRIVKIGKMGRSRSRSKSPSRRRHKSKHSRKRSKSREKRSSSKYSEKPKERSSKSRFVCINVLYRDHDVCYECGEHEPPCWALFLTIDFSRRFGYVEDFFLIPCWNDIYVVFAQLAVRMTVLTCLVFTFIPTSSEES